MMYRIIIILIILIGCTSQKITDSRLYEIVIKDLKFSEDANDLKLISKEIARLHSPIITMYKDSIYILNTNRSFALQSMKSKRIYIIDHNGTDQYRMIECDSTWKITNYGFGDYR